ncbi:hypothetical protein TeGR_g2424 [Tetraparma gracilis]|uniref:Uncharacterized protein n=1 Tax=Tetraparma gracilis TaxID=2962635 RepID=A0ABQ6M6Y9_9STRA|nr:hypothetical protein TeGR_g2424 [Tetraparma gracilis]
MDATPLPVVPPVLPEHPHASFIFSLAKFVSTLIFLSSLTLILILILLLKALIVTICEDTRLGLLGVTAIAIASVLFVNWNVGGGVARLKGLVGGMDM